MHLIAFWGGSSPSYFSAGHGYHLAGDSKHLVLLGRHLSHWNIEADHGSHLEEVLRRLQEKGIYLRHDKCHFIQPSVRYLGHYIDAKGIHTSAKKVKAIEDAPVPQNLNELRSFLVLVNYYGSLCLI